jgi:hypothetical protein
MRYLLSILLLFVSILSIGQTFTYSGYIYNSDSSGANNVPVKIYKRTTPTLTGFTSQTNYNGHSYYRSTGTNTWTGARDACTAMGGHLVTMNSSAENTFIFNTWPSGWIGFYQNKTLSTYSEPYGGWVWVTNEAVNFTSWNGGEPNNAGGEDYAQFVGGGKWNDLPNNYYLNYVIEFDYIVTYTTWTLEQTVYTNSSGYWNISKPTNPATEWYIQIDAPIPASAIQVTDITAACNVVIKKTTFNGLHYYMYDVNGDGTVTVSDAYYIGARKYGIFTDWVNSFTSRLFLTSEYNAIKATTANMKIMYPGTNSITITSPVSGGSANYYLIAPGYSSNVTY